MHLFDTVIVGGGPAGLSDALHLSFHGRDALVLDRRTGPLFYTLTELWNVPGLIGQTGYTCLLGLFGLLNPILQKF
jgi:thioredoxin reductase